LNFADDGTNLICFNFCITYAYCLYAVPIYDVRKNSNFAFTADDLANLSRLPLYEQGRSDLPPETLATVGYTVGCYLYRAANPAWQGYTVISLNILFVLALGSVNRGKLAFLSEQM
jgi:hypothetical protein